MDVCLVRKMKYPSGLVFWAFLSPLALLADASTPIVSADRVFEEQGGFVEVEAEHFYRQTLTDKRRWYITHAGQEPLQEPDGDPSHPAGASGDTYIEVLPDTRRTHDDELIKGENFSNEPGKLAVLHYRVKINNPGRYYVWVSAFSTGTEDNGIHVGLDGDWPESGQRMQWCKGKNRWRWESRQRSREQHCGEPYKIYLDIESAGEHDIQFSMREDGFEFDRFVLTKERELPASYTEPFYAD